MSPRHGAEHSPASAPASVTSTRRTIGPPIVANVSGAGVTAYAKHPEAARKLLEWLSSEEAQGDFAALNMEYPVNPKVSPDPLVAAWGTFKADALNVNEAGRLQADAIRLMDRAGYR